MASFVLPQVPPVQYKKSTPLEAKVLENYKLNENPDSDVHHIVLEAHPYEYREGQSAGVLAPGLNEKGKPHNPRLYSIASEGSDLHHHPTFDLCVKRVVYTDPETGELKKGVCSNYLCDLQVGETVKITGPHGKHFVLPADEDLERPYIFVATGTGIAPFRGMIRRLLKYHSSFSEPVFLFKGVRYSSELLYHSEFMSYENKNFHYRTAISREQKTADGRKKYVGDCMLEHEEHLWDFLQDERTLIYICGLKGMTEGVENAIRQIAERHKHSGEEFLEKLRPRILTEVY
ncbi:MAG: ferredoxin--NADP(+) reductase [Candidatus Hydrogenedentota bacterium]|nr:MAG: ferredoxin--NADP(+) reductase [Candidatus Hydrogenedentota bacterium]